MSGAMECISVVSDSRNLAAFEYNEFDVALSHSMTADDGCLEDQRTMMCDVGRQVEFGAEFQLLISN